MMDNERHRPRIALVASSLRLGGAEKQAVYIARSLVETGLEVRFYYLGRGGHYESHLRGLGVRVERLQFLDRPWRRLIELARALRRFSPDLVLASQFGDLRFGAIAGRLSGALVLGGVRSDGWYELRAHRPWSRMLMRLAHGLIANSQRARTTLTAQGVHPAKMALLPNVIDLADFDARSAQAPDVALPADRINVAAVGGLHPCKRFDRFLEGLELARRREPLLTGIVVGADLGARSRLEAAAQELGLGLDDVRFVGECRNVPALLGRCAMLALTSDYEGFPNTILEAMAARLPVITTPAGDAATVVQHARTGYVVRPDQAQELADSIVGLAQTPGLRAQFGGLGRRRVEEEYNYASLAERMVEIFRRFALVQRRTGLAELIEHALTRGVLGTSAGGRAAA